MTVFARLRYRGQVVAGSQDDRPDSEHLFASLILKRTA